MRRAVVYSLIGILLPLGAWLFSLSPLGNAAKTESVSLFAYDEELMRVYNPAHPDVNAAGLRGGELDEDALRIVFMGDSVSAGSSDVLAYPDILSQRYTRGACQVLNASAHGYNLWRLYAAYERVVRPIAPDVVVIMAGSNEASGYRPGLAAPIVEAGLRTLTTLIRDDGAEAILLIPPMAPPGVETFSPLWDRAAHYETFAPALRAVQDAVEGVGGIDVSEGLTGADFANTTHLNKSGHEKLADWLDKELIADLCGNGQ